MSKKKTDLQQYIWSLLYTYYRVASTSSELRSVKYVIEKDRSSDLVRFYLRIKNMIGLVESIEPQTMQLDNVTIPTKELNQVMTSIFAKLMVKKTHLLTLIQSRTRINGVVAADFCAILVVDYVKCRDKVDQMDGEDTNKRAVSSRQSRRRKEKEFEAENPDQVSFLMSKKSTTHLKSTSNTKLTTKNKTMGMTRDTSATKRSKTPGMTTKNDFQATADSKPHWALKMQQTTDTMDNRPDWFNNFGAKTLYEHKAKRDLSEYSPTRLKTRKAQLAADILLPFMIPNKRSVFLEQENHDPQVTVPEEEVFYLHETVDESGPTKSEQKRNKRKVEYLQSKRTLVDTRANMMDEMGYILKEKELTEDRIINGMALLKSNVNLFNNMLDYSNYVKKQFFDLYFKIKGQVGNKEAIPVTNAELRLFRTIDEMQQKSLATEVGQIGEKVLFTETLHKIRKPDGPPANKKSQV